MPAAVMQLISSLGVGGAERLLIDHVAAARALDRPHSVVVMNTGWSPDFRRELEASGAPVRFLDRRPGDKSPATLLRLLEWARERDVRIVHSHNPGSLRWSMLMKMARPSLTLVHTLHGMSAVTDLSGLAGVAHRALAVETIAVSPAVEAAALNAGLRRVSCIENGVALDRFHPAEPRETVHPLRLVCIGRIAPEKGQDILVEAVRLCLTRGVEVEARIVGDAAPEHAGYFAEISARVRTACLSGVVAFEHGRTDMPAALSSADALVAPSRSEGFGLALVEAMAAGLPVIAADVGGPARILRDHPDAGLLFNAGAPESLAERIQALATDASLRQRLAAAAPRAARGYAIEPMTARYEALYAALYAAL